MNAFKKIFCRVFQTAFHLALPLLPYREPKIYDSVEAVGGLLSELNVKSALLVTDSGIRKAGITAPLEKLLLEQGITCAVYDKTSANPTVKNVEEARELYLRSNC